MLCYHAKGDRLETESSRQRQAGNLLKTGQPAVNVDIRPGSSYMAKHVSLWSRSRAARRRCGDKAMLKVDVKQNDNENNEMSDTRILGPTRPFQSTSS